MKFRSAPAVYNPRFHDWLFDDAAPIGTFCYRRQSCDDWHGYAIWILMPYDHPIGARSIHGLRIYWGAQAKPPKPSWRWDGNAYRPTLTPSIVCGPKDAPHWHGYMTAGVVKACE